MIKDGTLKRYTLILLQALSAVLVSACICIYSFYAHILVRSGSGEISDTLSLIDFRSDYYDSESYTTNLDASVRDIARFAVIKSQLETNGEYNPNKRIKIGEFAHRSDPTKYTGPDAEYFLKDLIAWGQFGISTNGISHSYKVFDKWEDLDAFFGQSKSKKNDHEYEETYVITGIDDQSDSKSEKTETEEAEKEDYDTYTNGTLTVIVADDYGLASVTNDVNDSTVPMLDVISNRYLSCQGKNLEFYAADSEEYAELVSNLEKSALELYTNYMDYLKYEERYDPDNTNLRFYVSTGNKETDIYTNLLNFRLMDPQKLSETFKALGEYIYACPKNIDYLTNTPLTYDNVKQAFMDYGYFYPDDTVIWVGLDTTYPVTDIFSQNYNNQKQSLRNVPWVISFAAVGLVTFVGLMVIICINGRKRFADADAEKKLRLFDRMPIETELVFCALIYLIIHFLRIFICGETVWTPYKSLNDVLLPNIVASFFYSVIGLLFLYSVIRRAYLKVLFKSSIIVAFFKWLGKRFSFVKRIFWRVYDSLGLAIRMWSAYLLFLIFNTFWACMLFFSNWTIVSFLVLFLFDGMVGILLFNRSLERKKIFDAIDRINSGDFDYKLDVSKLHGDNRTFALIVNDVGDSIQKAVETSSKDEKLKADLITNVSHDIKTPLTSIINYVDLIKRENIDNDRVKNYIRILDEKSQRLKQLTVDLVEASKITSGNITLEITRMNVTELINQAQGEFEEKFNEKGLSLITSLPKGSVVIEADPRYIWRIVENLLQNAYKYAMPDTRVYLDVERDEINKKLIMSFKNISAQQLNIKASELTERFIRGDVARSSEGSGLGLSIVKSLVKAHNGTFEVYLDGDLFKATVTLPLVNENSVNKDKTD